MDIKTMRNERSFFNSEYEYFVDYGGRGSGKSFDKATSVILEATIRPIRILVAREFLGSIAESTKAEIETRIEELGLSHFFKPTKDQIVAKNGSKFIFKGLKNNINNIKSIAAVDVVIVEEAEGVSEICWDKLLPSIRPRSGKMIVIVIFNPDSKLDATWSQWIINTPEKTLLTYCNYYDSVHFPANLERQRKHDEKVLPKKRYEKKWLGIPSGAEGDLIIDETWLEAARFASNHPDWVNAGPKRVAYDPAGQGRDANAVVYADGNRIVEVDEWVKSPDLRIATNRAMNMLRKHDAESFTYDECGGFGDGVSVFVSDNISGKSEDESGEKYSALSSVEIIPFNAGDPVLAPEYEVIEGTEKLPHEIYCNQKAHAHGVVAQMLYNTFRFIELGERDIDPLEMLSFNIGDDETWKKLMREMSAALWVKSEANSKKKVESKKDMKKRTGQESPNINDGVMMLFAPTEQAEIAGGFDW
jgi:phage terminase large subunit